MRRVRNFETIVLNALMRGANQARSQHMPIGQTRKDVIRMLNNADVWPKPNDVGKALRKLKSEKSIMSRGRHWYVR